MSKAKESASLDSNKFAHKAGSSKKPPKKVFVTTPSTAGELDSKSKEHSVSLVSSPTITSAKTEVNAGDKEEAKDKPRPPRKRKKQTDV